MILIKSMAQRDKESWPQLHESGAALPKYIAAKMEMKLRRTDFSQVLDPPALCLLAVLDPSRGGQRARRGHFAVCRNQAGRGQP